MRRERLIRPTYQDGMIAMNMSMTERIKAGKLFTDMCEGLPEKRLRGKTLMYEWTPVLKNELSGNVGMLELIRRKDRFIHVPYHSFDSYIRILQEAAINKEVKSIKTTLYRLAKDSKVVKALINAARNGKKVTVVIELLARFDEASNIDWSKKMQDAGIRVIFGHLTGYDTSYTGEMICI